MPSAIVEVDSIDDIQKVMSFAQEQNVPIIPYGLGSGVLGGTVPFNGEIILDLSHMNRGVAIDEENFVAVVDAGVCGAELEKALNARKMTCGHYPQSLSMSTIGGWAACRGSGQASSRYGSIENMVVGLKVVLPNGRLLNVRHSPRRSVGPSIIEMFLGSEGTLGVIVEVTMRIWRLPQHTCGQVVKFRTLKEGIAAIKQLMQAELRPTLARLYDQPESIVWEGESLPNDTCAVILMLEFAGDEKVAQAEFEVALAICGENQGVVTASSALNRWKEKRYQSHSDEFVKGGGFYDTIEIAAPWSVQSDMYDEIRREVSKRHGAIANVTAHWSHAYSDGACMYMTVKIQKIDDATGLKVHAEIWDTAMRICSEMGGTISHHHGIGYFRGNWLAKELNEGFAILHGLKDFIDPANVLNPGKLGLTQES
ncbi:FAD-binding oxidoreductase [Pseudohalocynthiibacter sp. F2068]|uniref:FAD-binding oxidoreductase n=1 Tax=Pseudohalocynthiibacter sp. F2068 TaxID=2926418 RepID=UPI001FF2BDEF|nr:FAD-binding oxidoreductase [Pseudohalocynthiibacter sp. F2068]MCK0104432.1 FAD-binding oxidoreductase [Pseudohalocynthiibacter sp. F2068]